MSNKDNETRETSQNRNEESSNSFLLGVVIGGLAGAAAALLLAPKSGKEIRSNINHQAGSLKEKTVQLRANVMNKSNELTSKNVSQGIVQQSADLLNKAINRTKVLDENEAEVNYIPIGEVPKKTVENSVDESAVRKKLEEAKKAFEEEEYKITH
jgi:gas vesicle protein